MHWPFRSDWRSMPPMLHRRYQDRHPFETPFTGAIERVASPVVVFKVLGGDCLELAIKDLSPLLIGFVVLQAPRHRPLRARRDAGLVEMSKLAARECLLDLNQPGADRSFRMLSGNQQASQFHALFLLFLVDDHPSSSICGLLCRRWPLFGSERVLTGLANASQPRRSWESCRLRHAMVRAKCRRRGYIQRSRRLVPAHPPRRHFPLLQPRRCRGHPDQGSAAGQHIERVAAGPACCAGGRPHCRSERITYRRRADNSTPESAASPLSGKGVLFMPMYSCSGQHFGYPTRS